MRTLFSNLNSALGRALAPVLGVLGVLGHIPMSALGTVFALVLVNVPPTLASEVRTLSESYILTSGSGLHVDLSFGNVRITGSDGNQVSAVLRLSCSNVDQEKCRRRAERIRMVARIQHNILQLKLKHTPRGRLGGIQADFEIGVPASAKLEVDIRSGHAFVSGMRSEVEVDIGTGDADVRHYQEALRVVKANVGIGSAELWIGETLTKGTGFPRSLRWKGAGPSRLEVDIGTGDIMLRLD